MIDLAVVFFILICAGAVLWFFQKKLKNTHRTLEQNKKQYRELELSYQVQKKELSLLEEQRKQSAAHLEAFKEQITLQFENLSQKIFKETASQFKKDSREQIVSLLEPVQEKIKDFQKKVEQHYGDEAKERFSLQKEIKKTAEMGKQMCEEAAHLTQALKGDVHSQGVWGELVLKRILEASGLREDEEYVVQGKDMRLKSEKGLPQKPDVVIKLPQQRHLVVDSKVSLTHYLKYLEEEKSEDKTKYLKLFIESVKKHITELSSKDYAHAQGLNSLDFVFLFFPVESAFAAALQHGGAVIASAWKKSIIIVSPTTLLAALKTVAFTWQREKESKNVLEIARKAGFVYDKFVGFAGDFKKVGESLNQSLHSYEDAYKKLSEGRGNIVSSLEGIKKLGVKTKKNLGEHIEIHSDFQI